METLIALLETLNTLTPIGIIALLGVVIFMIVYRNPLKPIQNSLAEVKDNHLHDVVNQLDRMNETLQRIEIKMSEEFAYLRAKINGR